MKDLKKSMKILVIGCGSIGKRHIRNLISLRAGEILAYDVDQKRLKETRNISSDIKVSATLSKLWKESPAISFICVPTALHIKYALESAKRGCHLFIEKPLSQNTKGLDKLINKVRDKRLVTFVGYNYRFNDSIVRVKELLENKLIGRIISGRTHFGSYLPERHSWEDYRFGYGAKKSLGGGVISDALSHHLDYLIFLFGRPQEVFSYSDKKSTLDIDTEDTSEVLLKFLSTGVISLHANFIQRPYKHTFELIGEKATVFVDLINNIVKYYDINKRKWIVYYGNKDADITYRKEIKYFIKCIRKKYLPPVDIFLAKEELGILEKIKRSASIGRWIKI